VIHSGHLDAEVALRRQQEEISFPIPLEWLRARFEFVVHTLGEVGEVGEVGEAAGMRVALMGQHHSHESYAWRFEKDGRAVVYSTDSEHKVEHMNAEAIFEHFFRGADLVICDTMYSLAEDVTLKQDWGHSSNIVAVALCQNAGAKRLALFPPRPGLQRRRHRADAPRVGALRGAQPRGSGAARGDLRL
jgi:ribonuclease BN (tRNA processing enzyme)